MSNRSAISVAALFASILAGATLTSVTDTRAQAAADNCLTAPKDKTPAGSHWYYRLERGTKRQCWYLRDENDKSARAAPQDSTADDAAEFCGGRTGRSAAAPGGAKICRERPRRTDLRAAARRAGTGRRSRTADGRHSARTRVSEQSGCKLSQYHDAVSDGRDALAGCFRGERAQHFPDRCRRTTGRAAGRQPGGNPTRACTGASCPCRSRLIDGQAVRVDADVVSGDGWRAGAGRYHREPGVPVRPRAAPARDSPRPPRDLG